MLSSIFGQEKSGTQMQAGYYLIYQYCTIGGKDLGILKGQTLVNSVM